MMYFIPSMLALLVLAAVLMIRGVRRRRWRSLCASVGLFALAGLCVSLLMEFIGHM